MHAARARRQAGRIPWGSLLALGILGAGVWAAWLFGPPYLLAWKVDRAITEAAARSYHISHLNDPLRSREERELVDSVKRQVVTLGVSDPEVTVTLTYRGDKAFVTCDYRVFVPHPTRARPWVLGMHRVASTDVRRVNWDD